MATSREYLIAFAAAKRWLEQELGGSYFLNDEQIEALAKTVIDTIDEHRAKRQQTF